VISFVSAYPNPHFWPISVDEITQCGSAMKTGTIDAVNMGNALGNAFARNRHEVMFSYSRGVAAAPSLAGSLFQPVLVDNLLCIKANGAA
jgi:hypothetical protein